MTTNILVIGATGHVGGALVSQLVERDVRVRALVRRPDSASLPDGVEVVAGDLTDVDSLHAGATGIDAVFLVWPLGSGELAEPVVGALAAHVDRIVYLSASGVRDDGADAPDPITRFHTELEQAIRASAREWTFLRSGGMATNTLGWAQQLKDGDTVRWIYGAAARSLVHEADLAAVGVRALTTDALVGRAPVLTGPATISQIDQVAAIAAATGRTLRWEELSRDEVAAMLAALGWPADSVDGALDAWAAMAEHPEAVTRGVEDLTGRPARTFREWADDHASDFGAHRV